MLPQWFMLMQVIVHYLERQEFCVIVCIVLVLRSIIAAISAVARNHRVTPNPQSC